MTEQTEDSVLVVITISPTLEDELIDWLLEREGATGFSSYAVNGHSSSHEHLSVAEQVSGRQRRLQFQVAIKRADLEGFVASLNTSFGRTGMHYWVVPLLVCAQLRG
jgi:Protein of unknown function (DUF3240)